MDPILSDVLEEENIELLRKLGWEVYTCNESRRVWYCSESEGRWSFTQPWAYIFGSIASASSERARTLPPSPPPSPPPPPPSPVAMLLNCIPPSPVDCGCCVHTQVDYAGAPWPNTPSSFTTAENLIADKWMFGSKMVTAARDRLFHQDRRGFERYAELGWYHFHHFHFAYQQKKGYCGMQAVCKTCYSYVCIQWDPQTSEIVAKHKRASWLTFWQGVAYTTPPFPALSIV